MHTSSRRSECHLCIQHQVNLLQTKNCKVHLQLSKACKTACIKVYDWSLSACHTH